MNVLVTAGPTREAIDRVRYITNASSGRMGIAFIRAALERCDEVFLVHGPLRVDVPTGVPAASVDTTAEMLQVVQSRIDWADALVMAAAPCDYRPAFPYPGKIAKEESSLRLELERTPDILQALKARKGNRVFLGFALEVEGGEERALRKLRRKGLDLICLNAPENFGSELANATLLSPQGVVERFEGIAKLDLARRVLSRIATRCAELATGTTSVE